MDTKPTFGPDNLLVHVVDDVANAVSGRAGESPSQRAARSRTVAATIMDFRPRDAVEAMIAGHCLIFHELIVDAVQVALRGEDASGRRVTHAGIVAMDRAFGANLTRLEHYRTRHEESPAETEPRDARAETDIADRVRRHRADMPVQVPAAPVETSRTVEAGGARKPSPDTTGARAPADPARSPAPMEADQPGEPWPASAASHLAGLNRQARREFGRQARKRIAAAAARSGGTAGAPGAFVSEPQGTRRLG